MNDGDQPQSVEAGTFPAEAPKKGLRKILTNDFWIGVGLSFILLLVNYLVNTFVVIIEVTVLALLNIQNEIFSIITIGTSIFILIANILLLILLAIKRRNMFFGVLAGFAILLIFTAAFVGACFALIAIFEGL